MSRTYRRRHDSVPDWVTKEFHWGVGYTFIKTPITDKKKLKKEIARWHSDAGWHCNYSSCPSYWIHEYHEVPFRRETRDKLKKITLDNCEEVDIRNNFKKPHIYYW
jgi:hypothetical protein